MKKQELIQLLKYSSPTSIWVVSYNNELQELQCPIKVIAIKDIGDLKQGKTYSVTYIKLATNLKVVFMVKGQPYFYYHFEILTPR